MHKNVVWGIQSKWYSAVILFIFSCMASPCFATVPCVTVGPSATGNGTGADWNDVKALPGSSGWAYGTRYYLQDGTYGQFTIGTPSGTGSPTNVVEVRKAQSYDYGRSSDGCTTDVSAGWNASTMGAAQAVFPWKGATDSLMVALPDTLRSTATRKRMTLLSVAAGYTQIHREL